MGFSILESRLLVLGLCFEAVLETFLVGQEGEVGDGVADLFTGCLCPLSVCTS